jgi:hypothetical protein
MNRETKFAAVLVVMALGVALSLGGCGSKSEGNSANITFRSDPPAEIFIGGEAKGTTPVVVALAAGSHEVTFKAEGFNDLTHAFDVVAGKALTVRAPLMVAGDDEAAVTRVASLLDIEREPYEQPKVHRGRNDASVMPYWPQKNVRKEGLKTYRIDVTEEYEGDGFLVWKRGREVVARQPFLPEGFATVGLVPEEVIEAAKKGQTWTFGVEYENKRKKAALVKFKIVDGRKYAARAAKLERRKFFQRQPPLVQESLRNGIFQVSKLHSEGLVHMLGVAHRNPASTMPFKDIVTNARRLGLQDTPLFIEASRYVTGRGGRGKGGGGTGANPSTALPNQGGGGGGGGAPLGPVFTGGTGLGQGGAVQGTLPDPSGFGAKRLGPGDSGVEVEPTPQDELREPGPVTGEAGGAGAGQGVTPGRRVAELNEQLKQEGRRLDEALNAEKLIADANARLEGAEADLRAAQEAVAASDDAVQSAADALEAAQAALAAGTGDESGVTDAENAIEAAQAARAAAAEAEAAAAKSVEEAQLNHTQAHEQASRILEVTGSSDEVQGRIDGIKEELVPPAPVEKRRGQGPGSGDGSGGGDGLGGGPVVGGDGPRQPGSGGGDGKGTRTAPALPTPNEPGAGVASINEAWTSAQNALKEAQSAAEAANEALLAATTDAERDAAQQEVERAENAVVEAERALREAEEARDKAAQGDGQK